MEYHFRAVVPALALSLFGGMLAVFRQFGAIAITEFGASISAVGVFVTIVSLVALFVVPLLVEIAGYVEGRQTSLVSSRWSLVGLLLVVGLLGHFAGYVLGFVGLAALVDVGGSADVVQLVSSVLVASFAGMLSVTLAGVAGAGLGYLGREDVAEALTAG